MAGFHEYGDEPPYYIMFLSCSLFSFFYLFFLFLGRCGFVAYFTTMSASRLYTLNDRMNDQLQNDLEGSGHVLIKVIIPKFA